MKINVSKQPLSTEKLHMAMFFILIKLADKFIGTDFLKNMCDCLQIKYKIEE